MKTLYLDCGMGAAGDMLTAALLELLPDPDAFVQELNHLGIPGVRVEREDAVKCGIHGTCVHVTVNGEEEGSHGHHDHAHHHEHTHHHSGMADIHHIISHLPLPQRVQDHVLAVYQLIAEAESHAHGLPVTEIHFHEVGTMDAIADITAVSLLLDRIAPDRIVVSPIHVGSGQVHCAHGILPVPAPATAHILREVPIYGSSRVRGELCTPTGAALLKHFATSFGDMPAMRVHSIGYGMGQKDFEAANCVRALLGESEDQDGSILELRCNVDDMTPEAMGFAMERLLEEGALDVFTIPVGMKKCRPGTMICTLCRTGDRERMIALLLKHTTTLGVRETLCHRSTLQRTVTTEQTQLGPVRKKCADGYGVEKSKWEFEDVARIAKERDLSIAEVLRQL